MNFSYDPTDLADEFNRLRLEIGDTDSKDPLLDDDEVIKVQAEEDSFYMRASTCCSLIASKLIRRAKYRIGQFSEDARSEYDRYTIMASNFAKLASKSYPWAASISVATKETNETDTSLVKPKFKKGMFDAPGTEIDIDTST